MNLRSLSFSPFATLVILLVLGIAGCSTLQQMLAVSALEKRLNELLASGEVSVSVTDAKTIRITLTNTTLNTEAPGIRGNFAGSLLAYVLPDVEKEPAFAEVYRFVIVFLAAQGQEDAQTLKVIDQYTLLGRTPTTGAQSLELPTYRDE